MGLQNDWVMQQIEMITRFVTQIVFNKNDSQNEFWYEIENTDTLSDIDKLHLELTRLIKEGNICEAEDMLFDNMIFGDKYVELATDFYKRLNLMTNEELEQCNFSRDEVYDGYIEILTQLGIPVEQFKVSS